MLILKLSIVFISVLTLLGCEKEDADRDVNTTLAVTYTALQMPIRSVIDETHLPKRTVHTSSIQDIFTLFDSISYGDKQWDEGLDVIPRVYLQRISCRWKTQSSTLNVKTKKDVFFKLITPAILRSNELIQLERNRLLSLAKNPLDMEDENYEWLLKLAKKYKIIKKKEDIPLTKEVLEALIVRVDTIPPSLALAQAAEESGWGTSRFASEGNALFGQWTFSKDSMIPKEQRSELGNYGLARFKTPQDSVNSYMLNLNAHNAYKKLREKRFELKKQAKAVTGLALSETLDKYSERGYAYVEGLKKMIKYNKLAHFDTAYLWTKEVIDIVPKSIPKKIEIEKSDDHNVSTEIISVG